KPTQHSVKELRSLGIQPDILICRSAQPIPQDMCEKMAMFCDVDADAVFQNLTARSIYEVPVLLEKQGLDEVVLRKLDVDVTNHPLDMTEWHDMVERMLKDYDRKVTLGVVGKYVELQDSYISLTEALRHAAMANEANLEIKWINAELAEEGGIDLEAELKGVDGILVPGGFGDKGLEGKISAIKYARENKIPFFGICLGMQCAVVEYARHIGMTDANTTETSTATTHPVIDIMPEQKEVEEKGAMRLGLYPCKVAPGSLTEKAYGEALIYERHRNRYEVNNAYREDLEKNGLVIAGTLPNGRLVEIVELPTDIHPWFMGVQFHPELKSRPTNPHPLFRDFIAAALKEQK
ncbi:MAG: CTP synthase, partial [Phascolarctobacterium sp.]|nr:CTP synthase [Phascolarctobacterium sp.]